METIKKVLSWLKNIFLKLFSDRKNFIIIILAVICLCTYCSYQKISAELQNVIATQIDSIATYKNEIGELYSQIGTYITDIEHLKKSNSDLYAEVKNLKDNPIVVTKIETVNEMKEIFIRDTVYKYSDTLYRLPFRYDDHYAKIKGYSELKTFDCTGTTMFESISFTNNITLSLIESKKGNVSFIAKSDNPYCQINNMSGVVLSPEDSKAIQKRFDKPWVLVLGVGGTVTVIDNKVVVCPGIQLTFGRKIFAF